MANDSGHVLVDAALVAQAQAGDPDALNALIGAVRPLVFRYCRRRLRTYHGGLDAAEDVTQDTCATVVDVLPRYQHQGAPFAAFVYAIAANKVADAQRRYARSLLSDGDVPDRASSAPTPEEELVLTGDLAAVAELLTRLPERMRQVLTLRASGLGVEEVACTTGISSNAVRVTHHRATARLRQLIAASPEHRERFPTWSPSAVRLDVDAA